MLNKYDVNITFISLMGVVPTTGDVETWITERGSRVRFESEKIKTL